MYRAIDLRLRPPYKSFATTSFYQNLETRREEGVVSQAAVQRDMDLMIKEMDENNIVYGVAVARESEWGGAAKNSDLPGLLADYPNRFIGMIHLQYGAEKNPLDSIDEYIVNGPCTGVYIEPSFRFEKVLMHADDERLFPIYEKCQANNIPLILQYGGGVNTIEYYDPSDIYRLAEAFPKLKICISHGGWPQVMLMIQQAYAHENVYLSPDFYFAGWPGSQDYVIAANTILSKKIIFGSAFPCVSLPDALKIYLEAGVKEENLDDILYGNAARFLGLEE